MDSYIFDGRDINVKSFNAVYELTDIIYIDLDRVILSDPVICNKNDEWYVNDYKRIYGNIVPLYVKSPIDCYSNGFSRYNESSTWKIGLDISGNNEWMEMYKLVWEKTEKQFSGSLENETHNLGRTVQNQFPWSRYSFW